MLSKKLLSASQTAAPAGDPIEYIGSYELSYSTTAAGTSPLITVGSSAISGVQSGDLLLVYISDDVNHTISNLGTGWSTLFSIRGTAGTSYMGGFQKTATSSDTSFTIDGSTSNGAPTIGMLAFRNAEFDFGYTETSDRDDPPDVNVSSGDATVVSLHYQDDNSRSTSWSGTLGTQVVNSFRYVSSFNSSGTLVWYNLSPSNPFAPPDNTAGPTGDIGATTLVLRQSS